jgi:hypothetical protein
VPPSCLASSLTLKMAVVRSSETSDLYRTIRHYNQEACTLHNYKRFLKTTAVVRLAAF